MSAVRDLYIKFFEKRASTEFPDYHIDNAEVARKEHEANRKDVRTELSSLFTRAGATGKEESTLLNKILPRTPKETSNPLVKLAGALYAVLPRTEILKTASPAYIQVAWRSFQDEVDKIASSVAR